MSNAPILVASIGNPGVLLNTFHSAAHTTITRLCAMISAGNFVRDKNYANGLLAHHHEFHLWQSPVLMNLSGRAVAGAWKAFLRDLSPDQRNNARLVVLHDELESPLGKVKQKLSTSSHKGHNGIKSCKEILGPKQPFIRIGIGIGRPDSRESADVSKYVLRKMNTEEKRKVEDAAGPVLQLLNTMKFYEDPLRG